MPDSNAEALQKRSSRLFGNKSLLHAFWQELAYNFYVERADFTQERVLGEELGAHIFNNAPILNRRDLGNIFSSMLRPRGQAWFRVTTDNEALNRDATVARFCDFFTGRMRDLMYARRANFVRATKEGDHDFALFGNAVLTVEMPVSRDGGRHLLYRDWHLRDCAWAEDEDGQIDTMFRRMKMTARQIERRFPKAQLSDSVKRACADTPDNEFEVGHAMLPIDDYEYARKPKNARRAAFASVYWDAKAMMLLEENASFEFRYIVPRWQTVTHSAYACSPAAMASLSDARGLQVMARVLLEAGEKQIDPPMKATEKAVRGDVNLYSGGITWVDKEYDERLGPALEPILLGKNAPLDASMMAAAIAQMKDAWYLTKLTLPGQAKTAYETAQLVEEYVRANIPLFEPIETEYNLPLCEITAAHMIRHDPLIRAAIPPQLADQQLVFVFSNPLQDAIEKNKVNLATTAVGLGAGIGKIDPHALSRVDWGEMFADALRGQGSPARWTLSAQAVAANDAAAAQQQQAGQVVDAINQAGQTADVVKKGAEATAALQDLTAPAADRQVAYGPT